MSEVLLIVDDDDWSCWQIKEFLRDVGYDMHFAQSGGEAFDLFLKYRPPHIMIDINIDSNDGFGWPMPYWGWIISRSFILHPISLWQKCGRSATSWR